MSKRVVSFILLFLLFLPSCKSVEAPLDSSNHSNNNEEELATKPTIQSPAEHNDSQVMSIFEATNWTIEYDSNLFSLRDNTDDSAVFALLDEAIQNDIDSSIYLSISYRNGISAEESAANESESLENANAIKDIVTINGNDVNHVCAVGSGSPDSTVYDIYYFDTESGCYALTLCHYNGDSELWEDVLQQMVESFSLT